MARQKNTASPSEAVSHALGIETQEIEDWSCCGATSAHSTNYKLRCAAGEEPDDRAEEGAWMSWFLRRLFQPLQDRGTSPQGGQGPQGGVESIIGAKFTDGIAIRNPIDIIAKDIGLDALEKKVVRKLEG